MNSYDYYNDKTKVSDLIVKFFFKYIDDLNFLFTKIGALINNPYLCALSWRLSIKRHNFFSKKRKKNILVLYRSLGIEDFSYFSDKDKENLSMFVLPRSQIKAIFEVYFGKRRNHILRDDCYLTDDKEVEEKKRKYRSFLENTLGFINQEYNFTTIIGFNFQFYAERELHAAASNKKIKFICLHKESLIFPGELNAYKEMLKKLGKYTGEKILVYNEYIRKAIISSKFINSRKIVSIGMPRADFYYHIKKKKIIKPKKRIFLILIINTKRNTFFIKKDKNFKMKSKIKFSDIIWEKLSKNTINNVLNFAKKNKDIDFIFKVKSPLENKAQIKEIHLEKLLVDKDLDNCKIISNINTGRLIKDAEVVIGFNSTSIIESLILNKIVVVPRFGIKKKNILKNFTLNLGKAVFSPKNLKEFNNLLNKAANKKLFKENDKSTINKLAKAYIGNKDGSSTKRLLKEI